ncbi:MAG: homoserine dehydrogenase [Rhodospirillales bacterium]|nr:homoserine dehydrogenase [Rhodospirillales bacterium]
MPAGATYRTHSELVAVSARNQDKSRNVDISAYDWTDDPVSLAHNPDLDIVIELIGGESGPAKNLIEAALTNRKHVITANKALLAHHGASLAKLAEENAVALAYEAAICGGIPIVKTIREGLSANNITEISGILNGTCNYILSVMEETGRAFEDVLAEAQAKGYAETPPDLDIDGIDAAHKLCLLAALGFGGTPDFASLSVTGIRHITARDVQQAKSENKCIRLIGKTYLNPEGEVKSILTPEYVPLSSPFAAIKGPQNAVRIVAAPVGEIVLTGAGAGRGPTASAVIADLVDIARGHIFPVFGKSQTNR